MSTDCLFCKIIAGEVPSRQVYVDEHAIAFLDIGPYHRGHTLVVPRRHVADVLAEPPAWTEIAPAVEHTSKLLVERLGADGLNIFSSTGAVAGQDVFHLHVHLVPRYESLAGGRELYQRTASTDPAELDAVHAELVEG
ncbi:HIT family protein [Propionibacteriaceae bacterium Y1685]